MALSSNPKTFSVDDRGFNYGDGVFTTMRVQSGRIALFHRHVERLIRDCERLGIPLSKATVEPAILNEATDLADGVLKVIVTAGSGGRGYSRGPANSPQLYFSYHRLPQHYAQWQQKGVRVGVSPVTLAKQPWLGGIKHLNRLEQVLIKRYSDFTRLDEVIVTDAEGCVVEASAANVFWRTRGHWFTPDLTDNGVAGVMRSFLLDWLVEHQQPAHIGRFHLKQLQAIDAMFISNALMQIVPVAKLHIGENERDFSLEPVQQLADSVLQQYEEEHVASK